MAAYQCYQRARGRSVLKPMIAGQRVLIVGTGPSAAELGPIPDDVRVLTCKDGLSLFATRTQRSRVDVYSCIRSRLQTDARLAELLERTRPTVLMSNDLSYVRRRRNLQGLYSTLVYDSGDDSTVLRKLIAPLSIEDICGRARRAKISTGMRLLQHALYFGARRIYLIGLDFGRDGYVWGERTADRPWNHADIDENFIRRMATLHDNIFSLSSRSPVTEYVPCQTLSASN
jgi:hypothetical protein